MGVGSCLRSSDELFSGLTESCLLERSGAVLYLNHVWHSSFRSRYSMYELVRAILVPGESRANFHCDGVD